MKSPLRVDARRLTEFVARLFVAGGLPARDAREVAGRNEKFSAAPVARW